MNPKQKYLQGLGGGGNFGSNPLGAGTLNLTSAPKLPYDSVPTANVGATATAASIVKPAQVTPQQQYTQNQTPQGGNANAGMQTQAVDNIPQRTPVQEPQTPKADPNASYRSAFDSYLATLNPTGEETAAQDRLNQITTQNRLDYEKALNSGETLGYSTGLAGQQARTAGIQEAGAAASLDALTGRRTAMTEAQKARLDFEKSLLPDAQQGFTLGAGDVRYDSAGNKIAEGGVKPPTLPASAQEYEYAKSNGYTGSYEQYQTEDANRKRSIVNINAAGLTPQMTSTALKLSDDYEQRSKDFYTQRDAYNRVVSSASDPSAAGDLALIFNYMKTLDPGSTVREGEFATAQNSGSAFDVIGAKYNKVLNGERLTQSQRDDFMKRATTIFNGSQAQQDKVAEEFTKRAEQYGVPANLVIRQTGATGSSGTRQTPTGASNPLGI